MSDIKVKHRPAIIFLTFGLVLLIFMVYTTKKPSSSLECTNTNVPLYSLKDLRPLVQSEERCDHMNTLNILYRVEEEGAPLVLPLPLQGKVREWLGGKEELIEEVSNQRVVQISGLLSGETTHYNPLRALRPGPPGGTETGRKWAEDEIKRTQGDCDFCNALNYTAAESWGRISGPGCSSAANVFKVAGPSNGLILSSSHSIFDIGLNEWRQIFHCVKLWFEKAHEADPELVFPMLVQDVFPKAGASKVHPHIHTWLGRSGYSGHFSSILSESTSYNSITSRDYWKDMTELHIFLGFGVRHGNAVAIVPLTSRRDHEVMVISDNVGEDFLTLLTAVMEAYHQELGVFCHSLGMSFPPIVTQPPTKSLPAVVRIGSRGACTNSQSDVSSLDLYAFYSVNVNPINTVAALRSALVRIQSEI